MIITKRNYFPDVHDMLGHILDAQPITPVNAEISIYSKFNVDFKDKKCLFKTSIVSLIYLFTAYISNIIN